MATLAEIRQKYPEYGDMSDEQFATAFHKKFYADMPFEDFSQKLGYKTKKPDKKEFSFKDAVVPAFGEAGNLLDTGLTLAGSNLARLFQGEEAQQEMFKSMEERIKKRSEMFDTNKERTFGEKALGMVATLPAQMAMMPLSPIDTAKKFIDAGETGTNTAKAAATDAALTAAGIVLPGFKQGSMLVRGGTGAAINAAQETAARAAISNIAETDEMKKAFVPSLEAAALAAIPGAGMGVMMGRKPSTQKPIMEDTTSKLQRAAEDVQAQKLEAQNLPQRELFDAETEGRGTNPNIPLDAPMRVDENGIPIRQDLSEEVAAAGRVADEVQPDLFDTPRSLAEVDAEAAAKKAADIEQAYQERPQSTERAVEAQARAELDESTRNTLYELEASLSQERVSKGQQRKLNQGMARGQRGAALFDGGDYEQKRQKVLDTLNQKENTINKDIPVENVLEVAKGEVDGPKWSKNLESGGVSTAMKRSSTVIHATVRYVQNAKKRADLFKRREVLPLEQAARRLSLRELGDLARLIEDEAMTEKVYSLDELQTKGFTDKQILTYQAFRKADKAAYEMQNAERLRMGKKPITYQEFHAASRWEGDHRVPVKDAEGKVVGFLAADTVWGLKAQARTVEKAGYVVDMKNKILIKGSRKFNEPGVTPEKAYSFALDLLGRDDPAIQKFAEYQQQWLANQTRNVAGQEKHFKRKSGVGGYVGDRPDLTFDVFGKEFTVKRNRDVEASNYLKQQINYLKNAAEWTEMQKAGEHVKKLTSDPDIAENQKNNVAYALDYYKNNLGFNEFELVKNLDDVVRSTGISPAVLNDVVGGTKTFFILQKLALSPGYIASNIVQTTQILPYLVDLNAKGYKGNIAASIAQAIPAGTLLATTHWSRVLGAQPNNTTARFIAMLPKDEAAFFTDTMRYAEDNGTISRSSYDESPIDANRNIATKGVDIAAKATMAVPESVIRAIAFYAYANQLRQSGKYKNNADLFQHADELVSMSMVDYRQGERPMIFQKMGTAGNLANTLQTYPFSFYNQWLYFANEAKKGNYAPMMTATALQMTLAGAMGLPIVSDLDKIYTWAKQHLPASWWKKVQGTFLEDPKLHTLAMPGGQELVYGLLSTHTPFTDSNIGLTSRVAAPSFAEMGAAPLGPLQEIGKQVGSGISLALDPTNQTKQAQFGMDVAPVAFQGLMEQKMFPEQTGTQRPDGSRKVFRATDVGSRDEVYTRSPEDQAVRNFGVRSQAEVVTKEANYRADLLKRITNEKTNDVAKSLYSAIRTGDREKAHDLLELYVQLSGKQYTAAQVKKQIENEFMSKELKELKGAKTPQAMARVKLLQEVLDRIQDEDNP